MQLKVVDSAEVQGICTWDNNRERFPKSFEELKELNPLVAEAELHVVITFSDPNFLLLIQAVNASTVAASNMLSGFFGMVDKFVNPLLNQQNDKFGNIQEDLPQKNFEKPTIYRYVGPIVIRNGLRQLVVVYPNLNFPEDFNYYLEELVKTNMVKSVAR